MKLRMYNIFMKSSTACQKLTLQDFIGPFFVNLFFFYVIAFEISYTKYYLQYLQEDTVVSYFQRPSVFSEPKKQLLPALSLINTSSFLLFDDTTTNCSGNYLLMK